MTAKADPDDRLLVPKHTGAKGQAFTTWKKPFLDACEGKGDDDGSWTDCFLGTDPQAGLSGAQIRRRTVRRRESYACLLRHLDDESLKDVIRAEAPKNGRQAWLVLERECAEPVSALHINQKVVEINGITIEKDIGISASTVTDLNRMLIGKNSELPSANQLNADEIAEKFLACILQPPSLAARATELLECPSTDRDPRFYTQPAVGPPAVPGGWERRTLVHAFNELWRASWKRGELG